MTGVNEFAARLAEERAALASAAAAPEAHQAAPVTAEAGQGRIRVTLGVDGRVARIEVDPKGFKEGSDYIAEHVLAALNEALDRRAAMVGTDERVPDLRAVGDSLAEVQEGSLPRLQAMSASIEHVLGKLDAR
ncbi:YbaB/EbfC family nucleoid-associated protein [Glycomyces terrestris]|uniref:YbaB/EbfC family DNA-binding protein n=1 Tax=Glycomyces terrestris TaxID=2493553 RepID=A0A426UUZ3_9ACTN|nr:YbaB/EbfC family nucleoid-associated protein [Glycomyces terrestris]RRR98134.1 YbaB/EbfC family DNA-binding protein [Glycomyces terrestris]